MQPFESPKPSSQGNPVQPSESPKPSSKGTPVQLSESPKPSKSSKALPPPIHQKEPAVQLSDFPKLCEPIKEIEEQPSKLSAHASPISDTSGSSKEPAIFKHTLPVKKTIKPLELVDLTLSELEKNICGVIRERFSGKSHQRSVRKTVRKSVRTSTVREWR